MSDDVIDLAAVRAAKDGPSPDLVHHDDYGRKLYTFAVDYAHEGKTFGFDLIAYDFDDAIAKVASMNANGVRLAGKVCERIGVYERIDP